jgi:uncharacterized protein YecE (DUF72 family)
MSEPAYYIGTMGFTYEPWRNGAFYPAGMKQSQFLTYYSQRFNALEMDSTFYAVPPPETVERWTAVTDADFIICPKTPRSITHELRAGSAVEPMLAFLEVMRRLGGQLGPVLIQFPPDFTSGAMARLTEFLAALPTDLRYAVEFRHTSWDNPETAQMLASRRVAWVMADYIHMPQRIIQRTADFLYLRFLGRHGQFPSKDREQVDKTAVLQQWYEQINEHDGEITAVYAFFNDDYAGFAPATANKFKQIVGLASEEIRPIQQGRLF